MLLQFLCSNGSTSVEVSNSALELAPFLIGHVNWNQGNVSRSVIDLSMLEFFTVESIQPLIQYLTNPSRENYYAVDEDMISFLQLERSPRSQWLSQDYQRVDELRQTTGHILIWDTTPDPDEVATNIIQTLLHYGLNKIAFFSTFYNDVIRDRLREELAGENYRGMGIVEVPEDQVKKIQEKFDDYPDVLCIAVEMYPEYMNAVNLYTYNVGGIIGHRIWTPLATDPTVQILSNALGNFQQVPPINETDVLAPYKRVFEYQLKQGQPGEYVIQINKVLNAIPMINSLNIYPDVPTIKTATSLGIKVPKVRGDQLVEFIRNEYADMIQAAIAEGDRVVIDIPESNPPEGWQTIGIGIHDLNGIVDGINDSNQQQTVQVLNFNPGMRMPVLFFVRKPEFWITRYNRIEPVQLVAYLE